MFSVLAVAACADDTSTATANFRHDEEAGSIETAFDYHEIIIWRWHSYFHYESLFLSLMLVGKHRSGKITFTRVGKKGNDDFSLIFGAFC